MKKTFLLILILFSLCINPQITITATAGIPSGEIIEGDAVIWENSWGRLEVYPHTSWGEIHQEQYCNATWKLEADNLDIAFRFDNALIDAHVYEWIDGEWVERTENFEQTIYGGKHIYYVQEVHFEQDETRRFKWNYDVPFNSEGKWDFMAKLSDESIQYALDNDRYVMLDPWWDSSWAFSNQVTINDAYIENDLWEFPVLVEIPTAIGILADGGDSLRFISQDNTTKYSHEVESFDGAGTSYVWVKIPDVRSAVSNDNRFFVYYGNDAATDNSTPDVWSNNYSLVYHMDDINDSTAWYNNATFANGSAIVSGKIGNARDLLVGDIVIPSVASINDDLADEYTAVMFVKVKTGGATRKTFNKGGATATRVISADSRQEGGLQVFRNELVAGAQEPDVQTVNAYEATDTWYHVVYSYKDEEALGLKIYVNGSYDSTDSSSGGDQSTIGFTQANMLTPINLIIGAGTITVVDEVRISRINRTESWINATYNNINKTDFISVSSTVNSYGGFTVNATTNITDYNATMNAYMNTQSGDYAGAYDLGFWYGTTNPPTATDTNVSYGSFSPPVQWDENTTGDLDDQTTYYVKAWASNATNFFTSDSTVSFTSLGTPNPPTNGASEYWRVGQKLNLSWTRGTGSDRDFVIRKNGSYPTNPTDGDQVYNTTEDPYYNLTIAEHSYFTVFSYNKTLILYSATGLDIPWGGMALSCYNESNGEGITFDIEIKNSDGSSVYVYDGATNPHYVDVGELPYGDDTYFRASSDYEYNYYSRVYYFDITINNYYNFSFYLADQNESNLYRYDVTDQTGNEVADCKIRTEKYNATLDRYTNVSILFTDGAGYAFIYLIPETSYQINLSKSGYQTQSAEYIPFTDVFTQSFILLFEEWEPDIDVVFGDYVTFAGYLWGVGDTLYVNYTDDLLETINTTINIYTYNYSTETESLLTSDSRADDDSFSLVQSANGSNFYRVVLDLNHTTFGYVRLTLTFEGYNVSRLITTPTTFRDLFDDVWKTNPFGWSNFIIWLLLVGIYFSWGERGSGLALLMSGFFLLFINQYVGINNVFADSVIPTLHIVVGFMVLWKDAKKEMI